MVGNWQKIGIYLYAESYYARRAKTQFQLIIRARIIVQKRYFVWSTPSHWVTLAEIAMLYWSMIPREIFL